MAVATYSPKESIHPFQTAHLVMRGASQVSIDYRLCTKTNIIHGPIEDVYDAYTCRKNGGLQAVVRSKLVRADQERIGVIG